MNMSAIKTWLEAQIVGLEDYKRRNVNSLRFHTRDHVSGAVVTGEQSGKAIDFYSVLVDIVEVDYSFGQK